MRLITNHVLIFALVVFGQMAVAGFSEDSKLPVGSNQSITEKQALTILPEKTGTWGPVKMKCINKSFLNSEPSVNLQIILNKNNDPKFAGTTEVKAVFSFGNRSVTAEPLTYKISREANKPISRIRIIGTKFMNSHDSNATGNFDTTLRMEAELKALPPSDPSARPELILIGMSLSEEDIGAGVGLGSVRTRISCNIF